MPVKKTTTNQKLAETLGHPPAPGTAESKAQGYDDLPKNTGKVVKPKNVKNPNKTGVSDEKTAPADASLSPGQVQVVSALVAQGFSFDEAVASLSGGSRTNAADATSTSKEDLARIKKLAEGDDSDLPPVEDVEEKFDVVDVDLGKREGFKTLIDDLWTRREELQDVPKKTLYRVTFDIPAPEFDWLLHRTISEGQARRDADYGVQSALVLLLKQQKALDPTRGGRRNFGGSGPKDAYNPQAGGWTK